jgi:hypothetical protein
MAKRSPPLSRTASPLVMLSLGAALVALASLPAGPAAATYSAPLTHVRIDRDLTIQTPSLVYASSTNGDPSLQIGLAVSGAQYILQKEWASGFGFQIGGVAGWAHVSADFFDTTSLRKTASFSGDGALAGGQLRIYQLLFEGQLSGLGARPSALTAFLNLRGLYYSAGSTASAASQTFHSENGTLSAGLGAMAELAFGPWFSLCPYAWFSPGLYSIDRYQVGAVPAPARIVRFGLRQPVRVGIDGWVYVLGDGSDTHVALSAIASLLDTSGHGNQELSLVLGYTF